MLQRRSHLAAVERVDPGVAVEDGEESGRVVDAVANVVVRRVGEQPAELSGVRRRAVLVRPGGAESVLFVADHVEQRGCTDHRGIEVGTLGECGTDEQPTVGAT